MDQDASHLRKMKNTNFFRLILLPFLFISLFAQIYANNFLFAFLVDNSKAVEIARKTGASDSPEIDKLIHDSRQIELSTVGKIEVGNKGGKMQTRVSGNFLAFWLRIAALLLLYFWMRPLLVFLRKNENELKAKAERRYNNFYQAVFSYILLSHSIWFITTLFQSVGSGFTFSTMIYHLVWLIIECYLFYLYLEPTLFMYVSNYFSYSNEKSAGRASLSIYGKLLSMLFFLMLIPMAIIAAFIYKDYIVLYDYQVNALMLITTSAVFLIGNMQLLYKSIQEPIDFLVEKMSKLAEGDFSVQTSVLFDDEIGKLKQNFNLMVDQLKEREEIRDTFGKYVSIEVAKHLIENRKVALGGETIDATILFSDIRNFTAMSEAMSPEEVVSMLNTYFSYITEPIMENHGVINKFIGDAVMAIFTPHLGSENHVEDAIKASMGMRLRLKELNESGSLKVPIKFGIGLNTGPLVAGNIGTEKRFEYTVIGDTVNVASRMESLTKELNTDVILSENTVKMLDHNFKQSIAVEKTEPVRIKGKSETMPVYKLL
jgi:class 3 adenylate cyclase